MRFKNRTPSVERERERKISRRSDAAVTGTGMSEKGKEDCVCLYVRTCVYLAALDKITSLLIERREIG